MSFLRVIAGVSFALLSAACSNDTEVSGGAGVPRFSVVTFNTGIPKSDAGAAYGPEQAAVAAEWYGTGLSFMSLIDDARAFFDDVQPDVVGFQEIFHPGDCVAIPSEFHPGFVCEGWQPGDPTVVQLVLGAGYQIACHLEKPDKCLAVRKSFGAFEGCDGDVCLDHLDGATVAGCGSGARVGRGVVALSEGGAITVVNVHGSSGLTQEDQDCRVLQFEQVFVDLGDGSALPAASGDKNLIVGDLNTDPALNADFDESAQKWNEFVGDDKPFHFITAVGPDAEPTYSGLFNIDHVASDAFIGECWTAGVTEGRADVTEITSFDHKPHVCSVTAE
jgi:hypothetical protein